MLVFEERGKPEQYPEKKKTLGAEKGTNKLNPHMAPNLRITTHHYANPTSLMGSASLHS